MEAAVDVIRSATQSVTMTSTEENITESVDFQVTRSTLESSQTVTAVFVEDPNMTPAAEPDLTPDSLLIQKETGVVKTGEAVLQHLRSNPYLMTYLKRFTNWVDN